MVFFSIRQPDLNFSVSAGKEKVDPTTLTLV